MLSSAQGNVFRRSHLISHKRPVEVPSKKFLFVNDALKIRNESELLTSHLEGGVQQEIASLRDDPACFVAMLSAAEK